jgi:hypothetical protein
MATTIASNNGAHDTATLPDTDVPMDFATPVALAAAVQQIHLPPFWPNEPELWLASIEASFELHKIYSPRTRYMRALALLPVDSLCLVRDLVRGSADFEDPYTELKQRLTGAFGKSQWQLAAELLDHPDLGDLKPSVLMARMLAVLPPGEMPHVVFLTIFLRKLPVAWQEQLAQKNTTDHRELAADLIQGACSRHTVVAAAPRQPSPSKIAGPRPRTAQQQPQRPRQHTWEEQGQQEPPAVRGGQRRLLLPPRLRGTRPQLQTPLQLPGKLGRRRGGCPPRPAATMVSTTASPASPVLSSPPANRPLTCLPPRPRPRPCLFRLPAASYF